MSQPADSPPRHRWFLLHLLGRGVALGMRIVPRRHRFGAALFLSRIMRPIIRLTTAYREHRANSSDTDREVALHHMLRVMTEHGTPFDLGWIVEGHDEVCEALASTRGVLFAAPHAMLATLTSRYVYDLGRIPTVIALHTNFCLSGTRIPARAVRPSDTFLIRIRGELRSGGVVCAMIDKPTSPTADRRARDFMTVEGPARVADALIQVATRCGARVFFTAARVEGAHVFATIRETSPASAGHAEAITQEFIAFVQAHVAALTAAR